MRKSVLVWSLVTTVALAILGFGMVYSPASAVQVTPVTATPQPSPTNNGGSAKWTVTTNTMTSHYPTGFDFALEAKSSAGKIVDAHLTWVQAPGFISRRPGIFDPSGKITATRDTSGNEVLPPWVGVTWVWDLTDEAGNIFQTPPIYDEYKDDSRVWHREESEDVIVFWQDGVPDEMGQEVIKAMAERRQFYYDNWGSLLNYKPRAVIFATREDFASWDSGLSTSSGGVFVAGRLVPAAGITAQVYTGQGASYTANAIVLHEVAHLYQSFTGASTQGVDWFIEGNADYFGRDSQRNCIDESKAMAESGNLPSLQGEGPSIRGANALEGYFIGCAFFHWLADTYGEESHIKLWKLIGAGKARVDALKEVTGLSFIDMETAFRKWLGAPNAVAPPLVELPTLSFPPTRAPKKP
jgi:hypothetical protein